METTKPKPAHENIHLKFDANLLRLLAPFAAKRDIRYYLEGLRVERAADKPKGIYLVSTDGWRMAAYYDPFGQIDGDDGQGVILRLPAEMIAAVAKTPLGQRSSLKVIGRGNRVSLAPDFDYGHTDLERYVMPGKPYIDARYVDWRKAIPDFDKLQPGVIGAFDQGLIASFDAVTKNSKYKTVQLWQEPGEDKFTCKPAILQFFDQPNFLGLLMPVRADLEKNLMHAILDAKPRKDPAPESDNSPNAQNC